MALKLRRGTNAERLTVTPEQGELIYTTDTKRLFVGDGSTAGGTVVTGINDIVDDTTPQLGADLDLNGNDITGTGNINITGTITATGSINLGDGAGGDIITLGGSVSGDLEPDQTNSHNIGSTSKRWLDGFFSSLDVTGEIRAGSLSVDDIANSDSALIYDSSLGKFIGDIEGNLTGSVVGDVKGSVFADDSTIIVDAVNGTLTGDVTGSVIANDGDTAYDADAKVFTAQTITANVKLNTAALDATNLVETAEVKAVGSSTHGILQLRYDNGGVSVGDQVSLGRILFGDNDSGVNWTVDVTKDYMNFFPNYTGTPDYTKFAQVWQNGKFQIGGEAGGSGFQGMVREPNATLEVYGDALIGDISINQNTISMNDSNGNLRLATNGTGTIELDVPVQTTVGAAGAADALPATPSTYFKINVGGTDYVVPAYAVS